MPSIARSRLVQIYRKLILLLAITAITGRATTPGRWRNSGKPKRALPNSADVILAIAALQRRLGHWDEAIAEQRRAVELDPRNFHASFNLAMTYTDAAPFSRSSS